MGCSVHTRLISLVVMSVLLMAQTLPCLAQAVPPQTATLAGTPTHQHVWQSRSADAQSMSNDNVTSNAMPQRSTHSHFDSLNPGGAISHRDVKAGDLGAVLRHASVPSRLLAA